MAVVDQRAIVAGPRTFFLEGVKTKYEKIIISGSESGYLTMSVTVPFAKSIRAIRAKTVGQVFFGTDLYLLAEGELVEKKYAVGPGGPASVTLVFNGVGGNLSFIKYAAIAAGQGGATPAVDSMLMNAAAFYVINGVSVTADVNTVNSPDAYKSNLVSKNIIADTWTEELKKTASGGSFDMPNAFRGIANKILYADADPGVSGIFARGAATTPLSAVDARFKLIASIVGATDQDLISKFYGAGNAKGDLNPFLSTVLSENTTGEHSVMEVFRILADRAYHLVTEMVAPPLVSEGGEPTLGRVMVVPRLFSADPPVCNVFLRRMCTSVVYGVTALKNTRLIISQHFGTASPTTVVAAVAPVALGDAIVGGKSKTAKMFAAITQEESEVGVLAQNIANPYGSSLPLEDNLDMLSAWFNKTNHLRFTDTRTASQLAVVGMEFNPFVAVGFPGIFFDPFLGAGRGFVKTVTHVITPSSAATEVIMNHCVFSDAMEYLTDETNIETGFDGELPGYKNGRVSEIYEDALGCQSLSAAAEGLLNPKPPPVEGPVHELPEIDTPPPTPPGGVSGGIPADQVIGTPEFKAAQKAEANAKRLAFIAEAVNDKLSGSAKTADDKSAIYEFISRPLASYRDLISFYGVSVAPGPDAPLPVEGPVHELPEIDTPPDKSIPNRLSLDQVYVDSEAEPPIVITIDYMDGGAGTTLAYVAPAQSPDEAVIGSNGDGLDKYQVADRVSAVIDYVNEVQ